MPKRKPSKAKHFVASPVQFAATRTAQNHRLQAIRECLRDLQGVELIYAIRLDDGIIKIGRTSHIIERRAHLNTDPEALLAIEPGTFEDERRIHAALRNSVAYAREYYHPTAEVLAYVNGLRDKLGVDPIAV